MIDRPLINTTLVGGNTINCIIVNMLVNYFFENFTQRW
jgi:hypothetical protein